MFIIILQLLSKFVLKVRVIIKTIKKYIKSTTKKCLFLQRTQKDSTFTIWKKAKYIYKIFMDIAPSLIST